MPENNDIKALLALLRSDSPLNLARREFSFTMAQIDQQSAQGNLGPLELRRLEFHAVAKIADLLAPPQCAWSITDVDENLWESACCGKAFVLHDGTPKQNGMQFCCYCGGRLEET